MSRRSLITNNHENSAKPLLHGAAITDYKGRYPIRVWRPERKQRTQVEPMTPLPTPAPDEFRYTAEERATRARVAGAGGPALGRHITNRQAARQGHSVQGHADPPRLHALARRAGLPARRRAGQVDDAQLEGGGLRRTSLSVCGPRLRHGQRRRRAAGTLPRGSRGTARAVRGRSDRAVALNARDAHMGQARRGGGVDDRGDGRAHLLRGARRSATASRTRW